MNQFNPGHSDIFIGLLGYTIDVCRDGYCRLNLPVTEKLLKANGEIYKMVLYSLCSVVINLAVSGRYKYGGNNYCTNLNVSYLRGSSSKRLFVEGRILLKIGRIIIADAEVKDESGNSVTVGHYISCYK